MSRRPCNIAFLFGFALCTPLIAATFEVDISADTIANDGNISLREAIAAANDNPGKDVILMADTLQNNLEITGPFIITDDLEIDGSFNRPPVIGKNSKSPGISSLKVPILIDAVGSSRILVIAGDTGTVEIRDMIIANGFALSGGGAGIAIGAPNLVTLRNVTVRGCDAEEGGGGILQVGGELTLIDCMLDDNSSDIDGGAVSIDGVLRLINTEITNNSARGQGGGVFADGSVFHASGGMISGNTGDFGGGLFTDANVNATLVGSLISDNTAEEKGGGIHVAANAILDATGVDLLRNHAGMGGGGGLYNIGSATIFKSTFDSNISESFIVSENPVGGGGILNAGSLTLMDSFVTNNEALIEDNGFGGGMLNANDGAADPVLIISGGEISGNEARESGGGISLYEGNATLNDVSVHSNITGNAGGGIHIFFNGQIAINGGAITANSAIQGGGLWVPSIGRVDIAGTEISMNRASGHVGGGGIRTAGRVGIANATIKNNTAVGRDDFRSGGGGINNDGILFVTDTIVSENVIIDSSLGGGGILNLDEGKMTLLRGSVTDNESERGGGGITNVSRDPPILGELAEITLRNVPVAGNSAELDGGGILTPNGISHLLDSTVSGNRTIAGNGGGVASASGLTRVINSTISGNQAVAGAGGGISGEGADVAIELIHGTVAENQAFTRGGGIHTSAGTIRTGNSIIASNTAGEPSPDLFGVFTSLDFNLIGDTSNAAISGPVVNSILDTDAQIGPLADNGGLTLTHDLLTGSPAIDAGSVGFTSAEALTEDQRGFTRIGNIGTIPDAGGGVDIGAVEVIGLSILDGAAMEDTGQIVMNISLSHGPPPGEIATVDVNTFDVDGGASQGIDYSPIESQRVTFTSTGPFLQPLSIPVSVDNDPEPNEVFEVRLSNAVGATIIDASAFGTILNDDSGPTATPTPAGTPTPTNPTDYDVRPIPPDGIIDALDLIEWYARVQDGSPEAEILFDFARFWDSR